MKKVKIINPNDFVVDVDTMGFGKVENKVVIQPKQSIEVDVSPRQYKKLLKNKQIIIKG
jgi:hypothetical protein